MPRFAGHKAGLNAVRKIVGSCIEQDIEVLTLFAFSSENWRRPEKEVGLLMELFATALTREVKKLNDNNVQLRIIGDLSAFSEEIQLLVDKAIAQCADNTGLILNIAANYGGRWDITQATRQIAKKAQQGDINIDEIDESMIEEHLSLRTIIEPDLFIRTGGEKRISNFIIWQLAYCSFILLIFYGLILIKKYLKKPFNLLLPGKGVLAVLAINLLH